MGQGRIYWGKPLWEILSSDGIFPDFEYKSRHEGTLWDYIHRKSEGLDIYFVINRNNCYGEAICQFRVENKVPELWDPATGEIQEQVLYETRKGRVTLPLRLDPYGSVFVVFRKTADQQHLVSFLRNGRDVFAPVGEQVGSIATAEIFKQQDGRLELRAWQTGKYKVEDASGKVTAIDIDTVPESQQITGSLEIRFPNGFGAAESVKFDNLLSWTEFPDPGVKYFSGKATYYEDFSLSTADVAPDKSLWLDLGRVKNIAEVKLNGRNLGILWKKPFRVEITGAVKEGTNKLEVKVTNLWPNRLIGDLFLPEEKRFTQTNVIKFTKDYPLLESGLLGPVRIISAQVEKVGF